jgi:hypothetical protein
MPNLSVRERRLRARGISPRITRAWRNRLFYGIGNRAELTTALAGTNNDFYLMSRILGTAGNSIRFRIVVSGASTPLSVVVASGDITVNARTDGSSVVQSTAKEVLDALLASDPVKALVWPALAPQSDGTGVVAALAYTNLAGAV